MTDSSRDSLLPGGAELLALTDAVVLRDPYELESARAAAVDELGEAATARAVSVAGVFEMMNRALDAIGAPVTEGFMDVAVALGVVVPDHLRAR